MGIGSWDDGAVTDPAARATVVSAIKGLLTRIGGGLPAALAAGGGLKVEGVAGGVAAPVDVSDRAARDLGKVDVAAFDAALPAGETHIGEVGGNTITVGIEFTRPADTAIYAAKDVVCNSVGAPAALVFTNVARVVAGSGYIVKARLMTDQVACVARFRLHLFNTTPAPIADNALYTLLYANTAARIGHFDFPAMQTEGAGSTAANAILVPNMSNLVMAYVAGGATRNLFGILTTLDVFTPASGQKFYVVLSAENN